MKLLYSVNPKIWPLPYEISTKGYLLSGLFGKLLPNHFMARCTARIVQEGVSLKIAPLLERGHTQKSIVLTNKI